MSIKERFKNKLQQAFAPENAYNKEVNPFAGLMEKERDAYILSEMKKGEGQTYEAAEKKFNAERLPKLGEALSKQAAEKYSGSITKDDLTEHTEGFVGGLGASALAGLSNGDLLGGIGHHARIGLIGMIGKIPFIGEFLGQITGFIGSHVASWFGSENRALSWSEAGDRAKNGKAIERLNAAYGQSANVNIMAQMVMESSKEEREGAPLPAAGTQPPQEAPATGRVALEKDRAALDKDRDGNITVAELDTDNDGLLTSADKEQITKQINNPAATRKLFDDLRQQGVTFGDQKVEDLTTQSVPTVLTPGNNPAR